MSLYRDSKLGLCLDLLGPDGNVFVLLGTGNHIARQIEKLDEWEQAVEAMRVMDGGYMSMVNLFREFFPIVTLVGYDEVRAIHEGKSTEDDEDD